MHRITGIMRNSLLRENYTTEEFLATQKLFARYARSPSLRSGRTTGGYAVRSLRSLTQIAPFGRNFALPTKPLGETILKSQRMQDSLVFRKRSD